jgi:hypothetical protein
VATAFFRTTSTGQGRLAALASAAQGSARSGDETPSGDRSTRLVEGINLSG